MSATATWGEVVAWAKAEIEKGRTGLESATAAEAPALQARIAVMREISVLADIPKAADMPPPVPYA